MMPRWLTRSAGRRGRLRPARSQRLHRLAGTHHRHLLHRHDSRGPWASVGRSCVVRGRSHPCPGHVRHQSPDAVLTDPRAVLLRRAFYKGSVLGSLKGGSANMDVLVALGTTIAFLFSLWITFLLVMRGDWTDHAAVAINNGMPYFETCAMLITFVLLGKILETRAKAPRTRPSRRSCEPRTAHGSRGPWRR